MIPLGKSRRIVPKFPQIDNHISQALDQVCFGLQEPQKALEDAAAKFAKVLVDISPVERNVILVIFPPLSEFLYALTGSSLLSNICGPSKIPSL